jgi:hypothetical protein
VTVPDEAGAAATGWTEARETIVGLFHALVGPRSLADEEWRPFAERMTAGESVRDVVRDLIASPECQRTFFLNPTFRPLLAPDPLDDALPRLYNWHVPKTGGSSLRVMLEGHFPEDQCFSGHDVRALSRLPLARLRAMRFFSGHFGPAVPRLLTDVPLVTVTLLREPVAHAASWYGQIRRHGPTGHVASDLARRLSFDEWCRRDETLPWWQNLQARMLALELRPVPWPAVAEATAATGEPLPPCLPDGDLERIALATLESIDVVGTTGDLLGAYTACLRRMGMATLRTASVHANRGDRGLIALDDSTRSWILEHNAVDGLLYDRARARARDLSQ